ncbi:MAG: response regulator transcription factor [Nitrospirales bacterium]
MNDLTQPARLFLVDDHTLVLEGLKKLLEPHYHIVGDAQGADNLIEQVKQLKPDILLMDVTLPGQNGYEITRKLKALYPSLKVIFVSMHLEPTFIMEAFRAGGDGYVPKQTAAKELMAAIDQVHRNKLYISPIVPENVKQSIFDQMQGIPGNELSGKLTTRQTEILKLVAQGFSAKDMAETLGISESTVAFHKTQIMQALGLKTKADLTKYAVQKGISTTQ